jgi:hypothetical protein
VKREGGDRELSVALAQDIELLSALLGESVCLPEDARVDRLGVLVERVGLFGQRWRSSPARGTSDPRRLDTGIRPGSACAGETELAPFMGASEGVAMFKER